MEMKLLQAACVRGEVCEAGDVLDVPEQSAGYFFEHGLGEPTNPEDRARLEGREMIDDPNPVPTLETAALDDKAAPKTRKKRSARK